MSVKDYDTEKGYGGGTTVEERRTPPDVDKANYDGQIDEGIAPEEDLHRGLKARQISMIAIGGSIGTGLVIGSGTALTRGGPVGLLLSYIVMGFCAFSTMMSLGEMATYLPTKKGFGGYASRFIDPALGVAVGYCYLAKYLVVTPNNIVAGSLVVQYWTDKVPVAAWITIYIVVIVMLNLLGIKLFGEIEFWASFIKILTLTGLILLGLVIDLGGVPNIDRIGFRYWKDQPFSHYLFQNDTGVFLGFWSCMTSALFAYMGIELVGVTFGEAKNPRKTVPATIRRTFVRICVFYIGSVFVVGLIVKATDPDLIAVTKKIRILPGIINGAILLFVLSAANSDLYIGTRTLYALAAQGQAPRFFMRVNRFGTPYFATAFCATVCCIAFLAADSGSYTVFGYFTATVTLLGALTWMSILASHIAFMRALKAQGISRDTLPWKAPGEPYVAYIAFVITAIVTFFKGFDSFIPKFNYRTFITNYCGIPFYIALFVGWKLYYKTRIIPSAEVDLISGRREFDDDEAAWEEKEAIRGKQPWWKRAWDGA
ncbi:amino acid transporter [Rhodotorula kratochvilovae]